MRKVVGLAATAVGALAASGAPPAHANFTSAVYISRPTNSYPQLTIKNTSGSSFTGLKLEATTKTGTASMSLGSAAVGTHVFTIRATPYFGLHGSATKATQSMAFKIVGNGISSTKNFTGDHGHWLNFGGTATAPSNSGYSLASQFVANLADPSSAAVPEPASIALLAAGLVGVGIGRRRKRIAAPC